MCEHEGRFDQARHTGGRLEVPDVGFDGTDPERTIGRSPLTQRGMQGTQLDRVTERRAGPVRLHIADVAWCEAGIAQCGSNDLLLGRRHWARSGRCSGRLD